MSNGKRVDQRTRSLRSPRSIYRVHYSMQRREEVTAAPPAVLQAYGLQVAGHKNGDNDKYLGLLTCNNGTIMKPIIKESQRRELDFYNTLAKTSRADLLELRQLVPKFFGCRRFVFRGFEQEYIVLEDIAERMLEPCIMDVKIGRVTWDPLAGPDKILREQSKYARCKQQYAFCIPGVHVRRRGAERALGKDHGKKLHGKAVKETIRSFVCGAGAPSRALLLQLLSGLWRTQRWARAQTAVRLRAASLLLVYDARRLEDCSDSEKKANVYVAPPRRHSVGGSNFSGQVTPRGPLHPRLCGGPLTPPPRAAPPPPLASPWSEALARAAQSHAFDHNYEDNLSRIKMDYRTVLDQLANDEPTPTRWAYVKVIDFAHAFFNEEDDETIDENFKEGIDNFVVIFEELLRETDDQVGGLT